MDVGLGLDPGNGGTAAALPVLGSADCSGCTGSLVFAARTGVSEASAPLAGVFFEGGAVGFFNSMAPNK